MTKRNIYTCEKVLKSPGAEAALVMGPDEERNEGTSNYALTRGPKL